MQSYTKPLDDGTIETVKEMFYGNSESEMTEEMDNRRRIMGELGYDTERTKLEISKKREIKLARKLATQAVDKAKKKKAAKQAKMARKRNKKS